MTVTVGGLPTIHNADVDLRYNTPTNPFFTSSITADTDRVFGLVVEDGTDTTAITEPIGSAGLVTEYSNIENTDGSNIRCYNSHATTGLNLASIDLTANDFFVLIHSDNANLHHFAKIIKVKSADVTGDMFEFEPKLGNQINRDVKFMVFKGPAVSNTVLALTCGLIATPHNDVVCAKPLWYFYNDKLDKKNELNHGTKYLVKMDEANSGSSITVNTHVSTFVTVNEYRNKIVDYSKFSYVIKTKDNLKVFDDPDTLTKNENYTGGGTDYTEYNESFYNARRNASNVLGPLNSGGDNLQVFTGPNRYLTYATSPNSVNLLPVTLSTYVQESIDGKAGFAETKLIDDGNIYSSKLTVDDKYTVRQEILSGQFEEWVHIGEIVSLQSSAANNTIYVVDIVNGFYQDTSAYFSADTEVKVNDRIIKIITPPNSTTLSFHDTSRLETESEFVTTFDMDTLAVGSNIYRRRFNTKDNSLIADMEFSDNSINKLKVILYSSAYKNAEISLSSFPSGYSNKYKLIFLTDNKNYRGQKQTYYTGLQYVKGAFVIVNEVFTGKIEKIEKQIENGMSFLIIQGRNTFSKLIDPITSKETLFSEDIIYSGKSPFNGKTAKTGNTPSTSGTATTGTFDFNDKTITLNQNTNFTKNDKVWGGTYGNQFIGEVDADSTNNSIELYNYPLTKGTAAAIYVENNKKYIFNKALASNPYISSSTDLNGASDKGLFFTAGNKLDDGAATPTDTFNALVENGVLGGTSSDDDTNAIGYRINKIENILTDSIFSAVLEGFTSDVMNTLLDFTIVSIKKGDNPIVKLAPYIPITLGRSQPNYANNKDSGTATSLGTTASQGTYYTNTNISKVKISSPTNAQETALYALQAGDAIYNSDGFVGRCMGGIDGYVNDDIYLTFEKPVDHGKLDSKELFIYEISTINDKKQHDLLLTNGEHLHGGKMISLLGPQNHPLNYSIFNNANQVTYQATFGMSIFRIISLEKGEIGPMYYSNQNSNVDGVHHRKKVTVPFYMPELEFNYYATAYKGLDITTVNKSGTSPNRGWPHEQCGLVPITGSNYYDRTRYPNASSSSIGHNFVYPIHTGLDGISDTIYSKSAFYHIDPSASRLFLFVNSDKYIYSSTRKDSLMNAATRTLTDYNLLTMSEPKLDTTREEKESLIGDTTRQTLIDNSYKSNTIIESDKTLSDLTRFGLMRLTECVWDIMWNPINPEKKQDTQKTVYSNVNEYSYDLDSKKGGGDLIINSWSGNVATFADADLDVGDYLVDMFPTTQLSRIFGVVGSISTNDVTINSATAVKTVLTSNAPAYPTGTVYRIPAASVALDSKITGFGKKEGYLFEGDNINLAKSVVFSDTLGGFSSQTSSDWYKEYSQLISNAGGTTRGDGRKGILLPIAFEQSSTSYANNPIITTISQTCTSDGTTSLTVADSSVFSVGDLIQRKTALGLSDTASAYNFITAIPDSTHVTLNAAATDSDTGTVVFTVKRSPTTHHNNAIFKWWDKFNLVREDSAVPETDLLQLKCTLLQGHTVNGGSGYMTAGTSVRLQTLTWCSVTSIHKTYTFPIFTVNEHDYASYTGSKKSSTDTSAYSLDGAVIGIKAGIYSGDIGDEISSATSRKANNNATYQEYSIQLDTKYKFLEMVDLTGCYLVPCAGTYESGTAFSALANTDPYSTHNLTVNDIIYVVSHEYDTKTSMSNINTDSCVLTLDKAFTTNINYKIMQPNPVAFWPKSPRTVTLNELSGKYTKQADSNNMYAGFNDYDITKGSTFEENSAVGSLEGIQSMYVVVDVDNLGGSDNTVLKSYSELNTAIGKIDKEVCITDGNTNVITSLVTDNTNAFSVQCEFGKIKKKLKGVVSISETFNLTVTGDIVTDDKRALIGSTVNIVKESENLVEELLLDNEVTFSLTKEDYPLFASPDFQGASVYAIINYLLALKDKKITDDAGTLTVVQSTSGVIKDTFKDEDILEYKQVVSQFDFYNEVIVYGSGKKSTRKDIRSIKEKGRKTLEVFLEELTSKADVDKKAQQLLRIHSRPKKNLELKLPIDRVKTIYAGDVVNCEVLSAQLPMNQYIILEITHESGGAVKLILGQYALGLDDTFAELLLQDKKTKSYKRKKTFTENENDFDFFSNMKIKEMQLTLRKRTNSGTLLGFENALNTDDTKIGFGGAIAHTILLEEDL